MPEVHVRTEETIVIPERYASHLHALLRIVAAFLYMTHGLQKLFGLFDGNVVELLSLPGAAGVIETVAGALILVGLFTRPVAFLASGQMASAYFIAHSSRAIWPVLNGGELAAMFCFVFLYLAARGAGPFSLDSLRAG